MSRLLIILSLMVASVSGLHARELPLAQQRGRVWIRYAASYKDYDARMIGWWKDGWEKFAEQTVFPQIAAISKTEKISVYGVQIHHPWGRSVKDGTPMPMEFNQRERCYQDYEATQNPKLALALDDVAFLEAMVSISQSYRLLIYMGSPHQLDPLPGESQTAWVARAKQVYGPVLYITPPPAIGMDNTFGQPWDPNPKSCYHFTGGAEGAVAQLVGDLTAHGHRIYFEGGILLNARWALDLCSTYTTDRWWDVPASGRHHHNRQWGRWARPQQDTKNRVMIQLHLTGTDEEKREAIERHLALGRDVVLAPTSFPGFPWSK
jgi:hypothetical protein